MLFNLYKDNVIKLWKKKVSKGIKIHKSFNTILFPDDPASISSLEHIYKEPFIIWIGSHIFHILDVT